ncbi:MAG: PEP/pyruvate-binding domain-containing protein [Lentisphaeria bacterium]
MKTDVDQFSTGMSGLDQALCGLQAGDNVVFQVDRAKDYDHFVTPFCKRVVADNKHLTYFRFAKHSPLMHPNDNVEIVELFPDRGFERFLSNILDVIEANGSGACYVFDSLSELAVDWYSDRMLANFFMIACPYLYQLDTIAYFSLLKHRHSSHAIDAITNTAQVILVTHRTNDRMYLQPVKVSGRHSPTLYMLHEQKGDQFTPVTNSTVISEIFSQVPQPWLDFTIYRQGVWARTYSRAQEVYRSAVFGEMSDDPEATAYFERMLRMAVTRDERLLTLCRQYFGLSDMIDIFHRMIGTGLIGGKSLGMLLARAVLRKDHPVTAGKLEAHDSFFLGSDLFYTYIVTNGCWWLCRRKGSLDELLQRSEEAQRKIMKGHFPEYILHQFTEMLTYFGQSPIIVRSSSLLEDNYGNAFSGKYESVFCTNQGTLSQRLEEFVQAVRVVYCSAMSRDALIYREHRGLLEQDEQMALLVQRVSGGLENSYYFPQVAGVGFSFNPYVWDPDIDPKAGLLRMVFGLGTRAVDRTEDDYTRIVALNVPDKRPQEGEDRYKYVQHNVDILDLQKNCLTVKPFDEVRKGQSSIPLDLFTSQDTEVVRRARQAGKKIDAPYFLTFEKLLTATEFTKDMRTVLATLQDAYDYPVDIEFTANFLPDGTYRINLLQCRPFQVKLRGNIACKSIGDVPEGSLLLKTTGPVIGESAIFNVDRIIFVVPEQYAKLSDQSRYSVARLVGRLCRRSEGISTIMLIGPGRWGTSTPSLGVPVAFSEIREASIICELELMHGGLVPDISLGTHFFNDLVELDMNYIAVRPEIEGNIFKQSFFEQNDSRPPEMLPDAEDFEAAVRVLEPTVGGSAFRLQCDTMNQTAICYLKTTDE